MLLRIENIKGVIYIEEEKLPVLEEYFRTKSKEESANRFIDMAMKIKD